MKTVLIFPDGVAVRNFLCTDFIDLLLARGEVLVWHALPEPSLEPHRHRFGAAVRWLRLPSFREDVASRVLRQAKVFSQLYWQAERDNATVVLKFFQRPGHWKPRLVRSAAQTLGRLAGSARGTAALHRWHEAATARAPYLQAFLDVLAAEAPDVVFCAHQRASAAVPAMVAARRLGIPAATFVYSWDNLPKGRMAVHADHYLVWSDFMADELLRYHPEVSREQAHVTGTPQLEPYFDSDLEESRETFLGSLGLDPARPVVCFSGCDVTSSRHDPVYLADLARGFRALPAESRPQILFRRSPADFSDRYQKTLEAFPEIVTSDPRWYVDAEGDWSQIVATREDVALLVNVVRHCDAVVNVGSTMGMDFAVYDKPAVFIAYDPPGAGAATTIDDSYALPHFRAVRQLDPVHWARSGDEIATVTLAALAAPEAKAAARRAWLEQQAAHPLDRAGARCVTALAAIALARSS